MREYIAENNLKLKDVASDVEIHIEKASYLGFSSNSTGETTVALPTVVSKELGMWPENRVKGQT